MGVRNSSDGGPQGGRNRSRFWPWQNAAARICLDSVLSPGWRIQSVAEAAKKHPQSVVSEQFAQPFR
jgi:hypothetical protein